ncbi:MAG: flagellar protein FlaG [Gammaproteobacteria bacterium]|nr:flagellar protein FlaG [Gammaproteobacteria bacterium]MBU1646206.1 flagellar protein FlaG [Gammaproteobacteria bacterium]MBU1972268.1 flagellar protein FlaG [Gammaproteobacteria bacterium]
MTITIGNSGTQTPLPAAPQGEPAPVARTPVVVPEPVPQQQQPSREQVQMAMEAVKQMIETSAPNSLQFSIDDDTGKTIVRVSDAQTGEMIRQIPSKELLEIARSLDRMQGLLLHQKA